MRCKDIEALSYTCRSMWYLLLSNTPWRMSYARRHPVYLPVLDYFAIRFRNIYRSFRLGRYRRYDIGSFIKSKSNTTSRIVIDTSKLLCYVERGMVIIRNFNDCGETECIISEVCGAYPFELHGQFIAQNMDHILYGYMYHNCIIKSYVKLYTMPDLPNRYVGQLSNNLPHGVGSLYLAESAIISSQHWNHGVAHNYTITNYDGHSVYCETPVKNCIKWSNPNISKYLRYGHCTRKYAKYNYISQDLYYCIRCSEYVCQTCRMCCHRSHEIMVAPFEYAIISRCSCATLCRVLTKKY